MLQLDQNHLKPLIIDTLCALDRRFDGCAVRLALEGAKSEQTILKIDLVVAIPYKQQILEELTLQAKQALQAKLAPDFGELQVKTTFKVSSHAVKPDLKTINGIKNIIAVASGKGGVGKSTTTTNIALALQQMGAKVGILDADIYGPSQPTLLGTTEQAPQSKDEKSIEPVEQFGLQTMSIGYLLEDDNAVIWRAPMATGALVQLLNDTRWRDLDYLLIDLPPGTGDIQLTMAQKIPVSGALIVTTPQEIALMDVRRSIKMFEKVSVPVLGVVENMSLHTCSQCGHQEAIFGTAGGEQLVAQFPELALLGQVPLDLQIRESSDQGAPIVISQPESSSAEIYHNIATKMAAQLAKQPKSYNSLSSIVVEHTPK